VRNRVYNPNLGGAGRWMQKDPIGLASGDHNFYRYVFNEPWGYTDPMGLWSEQSFNRITNWLSNLGGLLDPDQPGPHTQMPGTQPARMTQMAILQDLADDTAIGHTARQQIHMQEDFQRGLRESADMAREHIYMVPLGGGSVSVGLIGGTGSIAVASVGDVLLGAYGSMKHTILPLGVQRNHLNMTGLFGRFIDRAKGLATPMKGCAGDVTSEHGRFHKVIDDFLDPFRKGGSRYGEQLTVREYNEVAEKALKATGKYSDEQINTIVDGMKAEQRAANLSDDTVLPDIPNRSTPADPLKPAPAKTP
jgi:hypothetical protein